MKLGYTRAMITAALRGQLDNVEYTTHDVFGLTMPGSCPEVPAHLLNPRNTWADKDAYDRKSAELAQKFNNNFKTFEAQASEAILAAAPRVQVNV